MDKGPLSVIKVDRGWPYQLYSHLQHSLLIWVEGSQGKKGEDEYVGG